MDKDANVLNQWFGRTIINSDKRFTYEEAQKIIETEQGKLSTEVLLLNKLAKKLRDIRFKKGALGYNYLIPLVVYHTHCPGFTGNSISMKEYLELINPLWQSSMKYYLG